MSEKRSASLRAEEGSSSPSFFVRALLELKFVGLALLVTFLFTTFGLTVIGVSGSSMRPNLDGGSGESQVSAVLGGDRVLIAKYHNWLRRLGLVGPYQPGQIVGFREPVNTPAAYAGENRSCLQELFGFSCRTFYMKRVIAGPGDRVKIDGGQVIVNGVEVDQSFITATGEVEVTADYFPVVVQREGEVVAFGIDFPLRELTPFTLVAGMPVLTVDPAAEHVRFFYASILDNLAPFPEGAPEGVPFLHEVLVPDGFYFVMGDNRTRFGSEDSRVFGLLPEREVVGPATHVIWPPFRDGEPNMRPLAPPAAFESVWDSR